MDILNLIGQYAFPIVACCAMGWYVKYQGDQHKEEMKEVTTALHNNTLALQKLIDVLEEKTE